MCRFDKLPKAGLARGLLAGECADVSGCIGTRATGECICYKKG